jgi:tripartite ATP-independent transporter DctM subunit
MAVAGLLGRSLFPTMLQRGYDRKLSAGTILGGASLDPIIPPSVLAILIATIAQISTGKLLVAGIVPGLVLTVMFLIYVAVRLTFEPSLAPDLTEEEVAGRSGSVLMAFVRMVPCAFIFFLVMGLVIMGVATPTEAAAAGVIGSLVLAASYRTLSWPMVHEALVSGVKVSSLLLIVMCCAVMFSQLLTFTGAPQALGELVTEIRPPAWLMLTVMMGLPFVLFMFLDQIAIMLVLVPIYKPLLVIYGFDEIWFFTLFLIVATVGGISPPFGYTLFAFRSAVPDMPLTQVYSAAWPFVWLIMLGFVLMAVFPPLITWLPNVAAQ